jgi:hypothetical protein
VLLVPALTWCLHLEAEGGVYHVSRKSKDDSTLVDRIHKWRSSLPLVGQLIIL